LAAGTSQRTWRAACPNCGAPVEFASAASPLAVCSFCRSTLARDGESLRRIGQSAELFDDHSPLQLGTGGSWQGAAFSLIGRLQLQTDAGRWNEWHALFDSGKSGWLSEDNGRYVMAFDAPPPALAPPPSGLQVGQTLALDGRAWQVASVVSARVSAAEGELPSAPNLKDAYRVADLRFGQDEVATLDDADGPLLHWSVGRSVALPELALTGLREGSDKTLRARAAECPNCGASLQIQLASTQSIACHQCKAVVDVSQGVGGDLAHYLQDSPQADGAQPLLPLGASAKLALGGPLAPWQVVGYAERCELPTDPEDERVFWREYLLYQREVGFAFLVDAEDGWSWTAPITGAPQVRGETASWGGTTYRKKYSYSGQITYVLGEFYWKLERGQTSFNTDYEAGPKQLNREQTGDEITWSAGQTMDAATIAAAFRLPPAQPAALAREVTPFTASGGLTRSVFIAIALLVVLAVVLAQCSADDCDQLRETFGASSNEYQQCRNAGNGVARVPRTGGGSYGGGYGGGGGHK
jgi:hypothetical protein